MMACGRARPSRGTENPEGGPVRVLVVEDEPGVAHGVARALGEHSFAVDVERDGRQGLITALAGAYDLIVLDIVLPSMNGYQVCSALREAGNWTPVLMLTAKSGELDEAEGLELGADDYLTKPFHMLVLVARVQALLRRPRRPGSIPYTVDDLRFDPNTHRCWRGDCDIELSARERDLLLALMADVGAPLSKARLLNNVWGGDFDGDPNLVEVYIRRLRRKIDVPFGTNT